jgi:hypothetical protein
VASFLRFADGDSVLMVISFALEGTNVEIPLPVSESKAWRDQFSGVPVKVENSKLMVTLKPMQFVLLVPSSEKVTQ